MATTQQLCDFTEAQQEAGFGVIIARKRQAYRTLGSRGRQAFPCLVRGLLSDRDPKSREISAHGLTVRGASKNGLPTIRAHEAIPLLLQALRGEPDSDVQAAILTALTAYTDASLTSQDIASIRGEITAVPDTVGKVVLAKIALRQRLMNVERELAQKAEPVPIPVPTPAPVPVPIPPAPEPVPIPEPEPEPKRNLTVWVAGGIIVLAASAGAYYLLRSRG